jgi:hypothetical protein
MTRFRDNLFETIRYLLYGRKHSFWLGEFEWEHRDKDGNIIDKWTTFNALANEGEENILDSYFRGENVPIDFYLMLVNDTPAIGWHLTDITGEPSGNGYQRLQLTRNTSGWPTLALDSSHYMVTSKQVIFEATGGSWGPVTFAILTTVPTGTSGPLIAFVPLSSSKTLDIGQTLACRVRVKLR